MAAHARSPRGGRRARIAAIGAAVAVVAGGALVLAGRDDGGPAPALPQPSPQATTARASGTAGSGGPLALAGQELHVDPAGAAAEQVTLFEQTGRTADAALLRKIADRPVATWFADAEPGFEARARTLVSEAGRAGRLPVLTLYHIPHRDCGGQSAGGAPDGPAYKTWISTLTSALQGHRAVVILEPDAVAQAVQGCLSDEDTKERFALLTHAIDTLRAVPGVLVYLDAGNPSWIRSPARMTAGLRKAGVARSHGFALNVANFETTRDNIRYGTALSRLLNNAHFVIDTSRNGNGPAQIGAGDRHWCNPPGRKLGEPPTTRTGNPLVDAYLWIKRPGESDGSCTDDAPPAGLWWSDYALDLAR